MGIAKTPRSLRTNTTDGAYRDGTAVSAGKISSVAGLIAVASFGGAEAQQSTLPPVTVDAPVARPRPAVSRPTPDQVRARNALRRAARAPQPPVAAVPYPAFGGFAADRNPYANPDAPYLASRLSGTKFTEPPLNTARTVTVLTKEVLEDKNATTLKEVARTTAGVTLGTGEGGNAFGDRFFIRGFDARNDIFIDGVRDPAVSIRENFFTEQVEILRGPASSFAGRGTTGGAINIVTKQATDLGNFFKAESQLTTDPGARITLDTNQVINPTLAVRFSALYQDSKVAGRNFVTDDRWGTLAAVRWKPTDAFTLTANYIHVDLDGLPDFGVPYYRRTPTSVGGPVTQELGVNRNTYYGLVERDFQRAKQDIGTINGEFVVTDWMTITNKFRQQRSVLDYVGSLPQGLNASTLQLNLSPQSRYQVTDVTANQTDAVIKFATGPIKHTLVAGVEIAREQVSIDTYTGLSSELAGAGSFNGTGTLSNVDVFNPPNLTPFPNQPRVAGNPTIIPIATDSLYLIETANYQDVIILNGGVRYDNYKVSAFKLNTGQGVYAPEEGFTNYNVGLVIKPLPYASVYAAYATSTNPIGAEVDGSSATYGGLSPTATINQIFAPEQNRAAEIGTKWELFEKRLLVTGALFHTEKTNARENFGGVINAGAEYRVQGIDLGVSGKITDRWSIFGGLVLMDTKVTKSINPTNVGLPLANIANESFNVLTKYRLDDVTEVGGQATYRSKIFGGTLLAANQNSELPSYWRFDAFLERKLAPNLKAKLFVNNILNTTYYDAFYQSALPFVFIAPGRVGGLVISAKL
ncbi:MAG: TonB-dependent receptor [Tardiphaga sp.]|nr:TonB-dependent receptor [Tardiphaga sp.]